MYKRTLRDLFGTLLDAAAYHPATDKFRFARLKVWYWKRFRPARYASLARINLGCGPNIIPGMCNVDLARGADLRFNFLNPFPLPDDIAEFVYCEHALEHFHIDQVQAIMSEVHRILRPGGVLRISVPRVDVHDQDQAGPRTWPVDELSGERIIELNRRLFGHEHKAFFSVEAFRHLCAGAGCAQFAPVREQESKFLDPGLVRQIEHRTKGNIVIEARKEP